MQRSQTTNHTCVKNRMLRSVHCPWGCVIIIVNDAFFLIIIVLMDGWVGSFIKSQTAVYLNAILTLAFLLPGLFHTTFNIISFRDYYIQSIQKDRFLFPTSE